MSGPGASGRWKDWLRVVRAPLAPTAACDVLACAWLARGPGLSRSAPALDLAEIAGLAGTSLLVYGAGMAGNDLADRRRDALLHPERPLPSGRLPPAAVGLLVAVLAAAAISLHGGAAGDLRCVGAALGLALLYDGGLKRFALPGALAMGGVRFANAATGVLPLVLAGTADPWALAGPALIGCYSAAVTILSTSEEATEPHRSRLLVARIASACVFGGAGVLAVVASQGPTFGAFLAAGAAASAAFGRVPRKGPVKAQVFEMLLGLYWVAAVLASGAEPGSAWWWSLPCAAVAFGLIVATQLFARWLRAR